MQYPPSISFGFQVIRELGDYFTGLLDFWRVSLLPFNQTDIRLDKKWNLKGFTLDIFLEIQNAFGQQTLQEPVYGLRRDDNGNVIEPATLTQIEDIDTNQILPTVGIVIDF